MKTLLLMRHAQAAEPEHTPDRERPLTAHGMEQARKVGRLLAGKGLRPDQIACSAAARTQQTCAGVLEAWPGQPAPKVESSFDFYDVEAAALLDRIKAEDEAHSCLLIIAHNPGIPMLASLLAERGKPQAFAQSFPPATCVVLQFDGAWNEVRPGRLAVREQLGAE